MLTRFQHKRGEQMLAEPDAEGFRRIHERHGDVQRKGWQVYQALAREQNYQGIFGGSEFQYGNSDLGPGAVTAWGAWPLQVAPPDGRHLLGKCGSRLSLP